ncbi:MAG: hypothetical protein ACM357_03780 [Gemmatimonadota bacterium]
MPHVITSEPRAEVTRISLTGGPIRRLIRRSLLAWWDAWRTIAADLGRGGLR